MAQRSQQDQAFRAEYAAFCRDWEDALLLLENPETQAQGGETPPAVKAKSGDAPSQPSSVAQVPERDPKLEEAPAVLQAAGYTALKTAMVR